MKTLEGRIRRLKEAIGKGEFEGLVVDRSKSQQEIDTQFARSAYEFQKKESSDEIHELERDGAKILGD